MKIEIKTRPQLEGIIYTHIHENPNCIIKIHEKSSNDLFYFTSIKLNEYSILLSMSYGDVSVGNIKNISNGKQIMEWIHDKCDYINFDTASLTVILEENKKYVDLNFRQEYLMNHMSVKKTTPILIHDTGDSIELFERFLKNDKCTKLVFSFSILIPDLKHKFQLDLVIDKIYTYNKTCIVFSTVRPDIKTYFPDPCDSIFRYLPNNKENIDELEEECILHLNTIFARCMVLSKEEINIYAYSNCEII